MATISYEQDADGTKFIPATQRPDGTWRKPRKIRDGYVPQEEVPLYESKGRQFKARQTGLPVGMTLEIAAEAQKPKKSGGVVQPIPGMLINIDKNKKKKKKKSGADDAAEKLAKCEITEPKFSLPTSPKKPAPAPLAATSKMTAASQSDPAKRLKNLRKKLKDIEILEEKIKSGQLKSPDNDQKDKMSRKAEVLSDIAALEKEIA